jgi:hypothetical protein
MQIQISGLMPGDVLIIKYNDTYWHTMLVVNNNRIAHAPSPGEPCVMEALASFASETKAEHTWNDSQLLERLYAYRYTGAMPYPSWVAFAEQWSVADAEGRITRYSASPNEEQKKDPQWHNYPRYRGVLKGDDSQNAAALPFGVDALSVGLPTALNYDAKYVYSRTFNYLLANDNSWAAK